MAWLRGFALFALLVAVPLLLEQLFGRHPMARHIKVGSSFWENVLSYSGFGLLVLLLVGFLVVPDPLPPSDYSDFRVAHAGGAGDELSSCAAGAEGTQTAKMWSRNAPTGLQ